MSEEFERLVAGNPVWQAQRDTAAAFWLAGMEHAEGIVRAQKVADPYPGFEPPTWDATVNQFATAIKSERERGR